MNYENELLTLLENKDRKQIIIQDKNDSIMFFKTLTNSAVKNINLYFYKNDIIEKEYIEILESILSNNEIIVKIIFNNETTQKEIIELIKKYDNKLNNQFKLSINNDFLNHIFTNDVNFATIDFISYIIFNKNVTNGSFNNEICTDGLLKIFNSMFEKNSFNYRDIL